MHIVHVVSVLSVHPVCGNQAGKRVFTHQLCPLPVIRYHDPVCLHTGGADHLLKTVGIMHGVTITVHFFPWRFDRIIFFQSRSFSAVLRQSFIYFFTHSCFHSFRFSEQNPLLSGQIFILPADMLRSPPDDARYCGTRLRQPLPLPL